VARNAESPMVVYAQTVGVIRVDTKGSCTYITDSARRILVLGFAHIGDHYTSWSLPDQVCQALGNALAGRSAVTPTFTRIADTSGCGESDHMTFVCPLFDDGVEMLVIERPIATDSFEVGWQSHTTSLSEIAAGVAHEVRNPLTAVKGFLQLLAEQHEPRYVQVALQEVERAVAILNSLLSISRPDDDSEVLRPVNVCSMLDSVVLLFEDHFYSILVQKEFETPEANVLAKQELLKKALFNLMKNAIEAMESGGFLTLKQFATTDHYVVSICDTGSGIDQGILAKLGKPFVTNKEGGTGLGVAMVRNMMDELGGRLEIASDANGSTFSLWFPKSDQQASIL